MENTTTISISVATKKELHKYGKFGQSYDEVIRNLLNDVKGDRSD